QAFYQLLQILHLELEPFRLTNFRQRTSAATVIVIVACQVHHQAHAVFAAGGNSQHNQPPRLPSYLFRLIKSDITIAPARWTGQAAYLAKGHTNSLAGVAAYAVCLQLV